MTARGEGGRATPVARIEAAAPIGNTLPAVGDPQPKTIVVLSDRMPRLGAEGNLRYTYSLVRYLERRGHRIHLVLRRPVVTFLLSRLKSHYPSGRVVLVAPGIRRWGRWHLVLAPGPALAIIARRLLARLPNRLQTVVFHVVFARLLPLYRQLTRAAAGAATFDISDRYPSPSDIAFVACAVGRIDPDVVFYDSVYFAPFKDRLGNRARSCVITHDIVHERQATLTARGYRVLPEPMSRERESEMLRRFDVIIAIHDQERETLAAMCPGKDVISVPMAVRPVARDPALVRDGRCIFVGSRVAPNVDGLRWFLGRVWPEVLAGLPSASLHVYGTVCGEAGKVGANVVLHGRVADLSPAYAQAAVAVVPMKAGSGLKIKMVEALAFGLPCVATTIGAQGLPRDGVLPFVVADAAAEFAAALVGLLSDGGRRRVLETAAPRYCRAFSEDRVFAPMRERGL